MIIGLIGGIACGKSTALNFFRQQHIVGISADEIAKDLLKIHSPIYKKLLSYLGPTYLVDNQNFDRHQLRQLLIQDPHFKQYLENLMHPEIQKQLRTASQLAKSAYCVLEIPLLTDPTVYGIDRVLCIDCQRTRQVSRLHRRQLNMTDIKGLLKIQIPRKQRLNLADDLIRNNHSSRSFIKKLKKMHQFYLMLSTSSG